MQAPLSWLQVAQLALAGGFPPADAVIATSITEPESARIQDNVQQGQPYATTGWGLWQITPGDSEPQFGIDNAMLDGLNNARAAHAKWAAAGGFSPWTTYEHGLNQPYLPEAQAAVAAAAHMSRAALARAVADIRPGPAGAAGPTITGQDWSAQVRQSSQHVSRYVLAQHASSQQLRKARSRLAVPRVIIANPATTLQQPRRIRG